MLEKIKSKAFWEAVGERAVNTFWQAFLATFVVGTTLDVNALKAAAYSAGMATVLSVLKGLTVALATDGNPAIGSTEVIAKEGATADPVGEDGQVTIVPDPSGEIAAQAQEDATSESAADAVAAPRRAQVDTDDLPIIVAVPDPAPKATVPVETTAAPVTETADQADAAVSAAALADAVPDISAEADTRAAEPEASPEVSAPNTLRLS